VDYWRKNIRAGNLYINRGTTGAIVLRQPFGGLGKSAVGSGRKAGAYNYVTQFMNISELREPRVPEAKTSRLVKLADRWDTDSRFAEHREDIRKLQAALQSYLWTLETEFQRERDFFKLRGEDNIFKYLKINKVALRICPGDSLFAAMSRILAAKVCQIDLRVSIDTEMNDAVSQFLFRYSQKILRSEDLMRRESEADFCRIIPEVDRIMYCRPENVSQAVYATAAEHLKFIVRNPPLMEGRLELLNFFEEQSISHSYHRYGNLGARGLAELA
jgi:RHH-type proline utilization regulon transcriptional repressor/proline dehydrogenase/delta 1-pyrroline-5-carboxylate dehydrogenase